MRIPNIKRKSVRRVVMVAVTPFILFQYLYLGLRQMAYEFRACWNHDTPEDTNV
ncbi:MAG: hypothetical protein ACHP7H_00505 [Hyphomicrobiales bacterium]